MPGEATIYRAGDKSETGVKAFSSWSENKSTAEAYLDNPGFGGAVLRSEKVPLNSVLDADTTNRKGMERLARQLGFDAGTGDEWFDNGWKYPWEESKSVKEALKKSGFDAIRYPDDFPEGATSIVPLKDFAGSENIRFMPDYSGEHKAPQRDYGAPLDNLKGVYPDDVYGPNAAQYYGHSSGDATDKAAARIIQATKGKPDAPVKVFRAIPKSIQSNEINPGDWITTIKSYAVDHGEGPLGGDYKILEKTVPAGDLYTNGDSIFEFGYDPKFMPSPDSAMPGAYSFPGGYRALPGKAKGSLRLYGPAGSLIGIASSLDEAQRILRRKGNR
jgi:hypothetical protein